MEIWKDYWAKLAQGKLFTLHFLFRKIIAYLSIFQVILWQGKIEVFENV